MCRGRNPTPYGQGDPRLRGAQTDHACPRRVACALLTGLSSNKTPRSSLRRELPKGRGKCRDELAESRDSRRGCRRLRSAAIVKRANVAAGDPGRVQYVRTGWIFSEPSSRRPRRRNGRHRDPPPLRHAVRGGLSPRRRCRSPAVRWRHLTPGRRLCAHCGASLPVRCAACVRERTRRAMLRRLRARLPRRSWKPRLPANRGGKKNKKGKNGGTRDRFLSPISSTTRDVAGLYRGGARLLAGLRGRDEIVSSAFAAESKAHGDSVLRVRRAGRARRRGRRAVRAAA